MHFFQVAPIICQYLFILRVERGTVRVKHFAQEHNTNLACMQTSPISLLRAENDVCMQATPARLILGHLNPESSAVNI